MVLGVRHGRPIISLGPFLLALNFLCAEAAVASTAARGNRTAKVKANALVVKRFELPVGPVGCKISPFDAFSSELVSYMHIQRARDSLSKQCLGLRLFPKLVTTELYELTFQRIVSQHGQARRQKSCAECARRPFAKGSSPRGLRCGAVGWGAPPGRRGAATALEPLGGAAGTACSHCIYGRSGLSRLPRRRQMTRLVLKKRH